ncbi:hypothetical protein AMD24_00528 [Candidatus Xiphinematobacter sp. Idaho Grape]|nr:hypothetical protein AMD24_00528 [Candidatus Xiphinematobacter sp. Idaho Grape]
MQSKTYSLFLKNINMHRVHNPPPSPTGGGSLRLVPQAFLMAILLHSFAALVLCNLTSSLLFERTHVIFSRQFLLPRLTFR